MKKLAVPSSLLRATLFWVTPFQFDYYPLGLSPSPVTKREPASGDRRCGYYPYPPCY
jgi:hypothetical protein